MIIPGIMILFEEVAFRLGFPTDLIADGTRAKKLLGRGLDARPSAVAVPRSGDYRSRDLRRKNGRIATEPNREAKPVIGAG